MPDLSDVNAEFFKPYFTVLEYFRYTGINVFDETNILIFKFKYLYVVALIIYIMMTISHFNFLIEKLLGGSDLLDLSTDLSFCYNSVEGLMLYSYMCFIKSRIKKYVFKVEQQWRNDSTLPPHVVEFKRKQLHDFDRRTYIYCKFIQIFRNMFMAYPVLVTVVKKYILGQEALFTPLLGFTMPFEYRDNTFIFLCVYAIDYTDVIILSAMLNSGLILLIVTMNQLIILFTLIQEDFKEIVKSNDKDIDIKLKRTIQRHSILAQLFDEFGDAFGGIFAIHFFFLTFTVCFYAISAKINKRLEDFKNVLICIIISTTTFYGCLQGQFVAESAQNVADAIYESAWDDLSVKNQKILLFTMLRSQQATYIKSTSFTNVCMDTYISMMKMTWSLISLITTVYEK